MHPDVVDITGQRFGRLLVLSQASSKHKRAYWICLCDCGKQCTAMGKYLRQGKKQSCGCLHRENRLWLSAKGVQARVENRHPPGEAAFNLLFASYRGSAESRGINFELSKEIFKSLTSSPCFYCGVSPFSIYKPSLSGGYLYNGIDRRDNKLGYTHSNIVPCCKYCNWMKNVFTEEQFLNQCALVTEFQNKKRKENVSNNA